MLRERETGWRLVTGKRCTLGLVCVIHRSDERAALRLARRIARGR